MDPLHDVLLQFGLGLATNGVYDILKSAIQSRANIASTKKALSNQLRAHGINVEASTIICVLAEKGIITITESHLYAPKAIAFGSQEGETWVGDNSSTVTDKTKIDAGKGAFIHTKGSAQVRQNPDGSISFHVGKDGSIDFSVDDDA